MRHADLSPRSAVVLIAITLCTTTAFAQGVPTTRPSCLNPTSKSISCNQNQVGQLEFLDCYFSSNFQTYNYDLWTFSGTAGQYVDFRIQTNDFLFDPRVAVYAPSGALAGVGSDYLFDTKTDDLQGTLGTSGVWTILVTSEGPVVGSKPYALAVTCTSPPVPGTPPATPTGLSATVISPTTIRLNWSDNATDEDEYRMEYKDSAAGTYADIGAASANATQATINGFTPGKQYYFRVRARRAASYSGYSNEATATAGADTAPCVPSATVLCIDDHVGDKRFEVRMHYQTSQGGGYSGDAQNIPLSSLGVNSGGLFWFLNPGNPELLIKVLNACPGSYWVFFSAGTNFGFDLTVRDTVTGKAKAYSNPDRNPAVPVQDTSGVFPCGN